MVKNKGCSRDSAVRDCFMTSYRFLSLIAWHSSKMITDPLAPSRVSESLDSGLYTPKFASQYRSDFLEWIYLRRYGDCLTIFFASLNTIFAASFFVEIQSISGPPSPSPNNPYIPRPESNVLLPFLRPIIIKASEYFRSPFLSTIP